MCANVPTQIKLDDGALPIAKFQVLAWETNREKEAPIEGASNPPKTLGMILHSMVCFRTI
jgi:hypothetical protein